MAVLSSFFGILAILIAAIGVYGVMSYLVARRTIRGLGRYTAKLRAELPSG